MANASAFISNTAGPSRPQYFVPPGSTLVDGRPRFTTAAPAPENLQVQHGWGQEVVQAPRGANVHKAPLLSEWLVACDRNRRGEAGDNFSSLVFGFEQLAIRRLSDLRDVSPDFLRSLELEKEDGSRISILMGTAIRLAQLIQLDLKAYDREVAGVGNH